MTKYYPDRKTCSVDDCLCLRRSKGNYKGVRRWGLLCARHYKATSSERVKLKQEGRIALENARTVREKARELRRNSTEKTCSKCGLTKVRVEFYRGNICSDCERLRARNRPKQQKKYDPIMNRKRCLEKYGVDNDWYNAKFAEQNGCCAICQKHQSEVKGRLSIDHSHETGQIRDLLCFACNTLLGRLEKNPFIIEKMRIYLKKHKNKAINLHTA